MTDTLLYVDHAPVYGGAETVLLRVLEVLDRSRFVPLLAIGPCRAMEEALDERALPYRVLPLQPLNRRDWRAAPAALGSAMTLRNLARREGAALMHTNTLRTHVLGALAAPLARVPLVWTLHDLTCPPHIFRLLSRQPAAIICVSRTIRDAYAGLCVHPEKMRVIYNGLKAPEALPDEGRALRQSLDLPDGAPLVVDVGRLVRGKGHDLFLRAAAQVTARHPEARFIVAGGASEESGPAGQVFRMSGLNAGGQAYAEELRVLAASLGLQERVRFTGFLASTAALYSAASVVVHAGTMPEGLPTVPLEAMAAGRPVVASDLSAVREIVEDGATGTIVPAGDVDALARGINALLDDAPRAAAMGAAGRERVYRVFDLDRQADEFAAVYEQVLSGRKRP